MNERESDYYFPPVVNLARSKIYPILTPIPNSQQTLRPNLSQINQPLQDTRRITRIPPIKQNKSHANPNSKRKTLLWCALGVTILAVIAGIVCAIYFTIKSSQTQTTKDLTNTTTTSASITYKSKYNCTTGYSGANCDIECGIIPTQSNLIRIVGGTTSVAYSWPSIAYIYFSYKARIQIGASYYIISQSAFCGGTLIDLTTVLTAAHCIEKSIKYKSNGQTYNYTVVTNQYYPDRKSVV